MENLSILMEYEKVLLGIRKNYKIAKKGEGPLVAEHNAIILFHYVFDDLLEWTPQMVRDYLTNDLINWLHLRRAVKKISFPPELDRDKDLFYIASVLYPDDIKYSKEDITLQAYERLLQGDLIKYPKKFFADEEGLRNLRICFNYAVGQKLCTYTTKELYLFFTNKVKTAKFLKQSMLTGIVKKNYEHPIDLLHEALPKNERSEFYYRYCKFLISKKETKEKMK